MGWSRLGLAGHGYADRTVTLRALMSAPDAPTAWDLRCLVRERFVAFLQREYPQCLPRTGFSESPTEEARQPLGGRLPRDALQPGEVPVAPREA